MYVERLVCVNCGNEFSPDDVVYECRCGSLLDVVYDYEEIKDHLDIQKFRKTPPTVWKYADFLPAPKKVSLGEGGTPLLPCKRLGEMLSAPSLYIKNEGQNPTGSFKDRGMTVGVSKALTLGFGMVACASTGNTSASLAAYAARAGMRCFVFLPAGKVAAGKLAQALIYGAEVIPIDANFDVCLSIVREVCREAGIYLLNSVNPFRLEGQKTIAFEIFDQLGRVPDTIVVPVGNGGNIFAIWKGFMELREVGLTDEVPRMIGVQAEGANPIVRTLVAGSRELEVVERPETVATAIRIGRPVNWMKTLRAIRESGGTAISVSDDEILRAQEILARVEGIFVEPASAASLAGLKKLVFEGEVEKDETVVCIATGHGLKDPSVVTSRISLPEPVPPNMDEVFRRIRTRR